MHMKVSHMLFRYSDLVQWDCECEIQEWAHSLKKSVVRISQLQPLTSLYGLSTVSPPYS